MDAAVALSIVIGGTAIGCVFVGILRLLTSKSHESPLLASHWNNGVHACESSHARGGLS